MGGSTVTVSPAELASRLDKDLDFLAAARDAPERHQSLRATFLHSWRLLSGEEQGVLRRLSVFRSAAPMEAAGAVAGATLALLTSLMNKSLVRRTPSGHVELHGLVRQYAWEQLRALPEEHTRTYQRHSEYFLGMLGRLEPLLRSGVARQGEALATFEAEQAEFRAAGLWAARGGHWQLIEGALESYGLAQELTGRSCAFVGLAEIIAALRPVLMGVESTSALRRLLGRLLVWQARVALSGATGNPNTSLARVEEGLLLLGEQGAHADVISGQLTAGRLALQQGNVAGARWCLHGALSLARASGNHRASGLALGELAEVSAHRGRPEQARRLLARGLATFRLLGDERHVAACLGRLATLPHARGELEKADSALRQSMGVLEAAGLRLQVVPLRAQLAGVLLQRGALEEARQAHTTNLQLGRALGHPETVAQALHGLGLVATAQGDTPQAQGLHEEALVLRGQLGARRPLAESLMALGRLELSGGNVPRARERLHAALRIAIEVGSPSLLLDVLVSLAELPAASEHGDRLHRALQAILSHPLTPHDTRQRAVALLSQPPPPPAPTSARPQLSHLVEEVLAAVGMA